MGTEGEPGAIRPAAWGPPGATVSPSGGQLVLGVLLYILVHGSMPFDGQDHKTLVKQISNGPTGSL